MSLSPACVDNWKDIAQLASYLTGIGAALLAVFTYVGNSRRERAKWAVQLFEKFYEAERYKEVREKLDCVSETDEVRELRQTGRPCSLTTLIFSS